MNQPSGNVVRFTAWSAIIGGILAYLTMGLLLSATGSDSGMIVNGAAMLALPADMRELYRWSMIADTFGFYLPFLVIGGYLLHAFREELGALGTMVAFAIVLYVMVGVTGALTQAGIIHPLADLSAGGDQATRVAAAAAWTAVSHAAQNGLWWIEGPLVLFFGFVIANVLKKNGWKGTLLLKLASGFYGLFFVSGFFLDLEEVSSTCEMVGVLVLPAWMLLFGWQLLRRSGASVESSPTLA
ncbi:hypothetical protein [Paraburkholderia sp.]|uniref:hypothetical protein n=1 Tax=Paraburkholderia sp. TaxID=1926495 RepID=UPI0025D97248|nr:hypothetical protein [Paraburkholderia sp.]